MDHKKKQRRIKQEPSSKDISWWKRFWKWTSFGNKSGWDWLDLLIVSLALAVVGIWFSLAQQQRELKIQGKQAQDAIKLEAQQAQAARELEAQRAENAVLQTYLDQMSQLMLEEDLLDSASSAVSLLARARTVTVLSQLEANPNKDETAPNKNETPKEQVVEFLIEAELIHSRNGEDPVISLEETDIRWVDLDNEDLHSANLKNAMMRGTNLKGANLEGADLEGAWLKDTSLKDTNLRGAKLKETRFQRANLKGADVEISDLVEDAYLQGATMPSGQKYEEWRKSKGSE
jgi:uncharacterized protein YjbI with pentapeptide repeats